MRPAVEDRTGKGIGEVGRAPVVARLHYTVEHGRRGSRTARLAESPARGTAQPPRDAPRAARRPPAPRHAPRAACTLLRHDTSLTSDRFTNTRRRHDIMIWQ